MRSTNGTVCRYLSLPWSELRYVRTYRGRHVLTAVQIHSALIDMKPVKSGDAKPPPFSGSAYSNVYIDHVDFLDNTVGLKPRSLAYIMFNLWDNAS